MPSGIQVCVAAALFSVATAWADTTITFTNIDDDGSVSGTTEVAMGKVRMSSPEGDGFMLFDSADNSFTAINHKDRSYLVFDREQVEKLANMQQQVMAQMDAQLAQLPAGQREKMRQMMSSMMPQMPAAPEPRRFERTGETKTIADYRCEVLEVYSGDRKLSEQCVADRDDLDIPDEDYAAVRAMQQFVTDLANSFAQMSDQIVDFGQPGRDEIPVEYVHYSKISGTSRGQLSSISHSAIAADRFALPDGYKEQKIPDMPNF